MAEVTVNHNSESIIVENSGTKRRAFKYSDPDNLSGTTMRAFNTVERIINDNTLEYEVHFSEIDCIDTENWESLANHSIIVVRGSIDTSWIVSGRLDLKAWKMDAINKLFLKKRDIEPMNLNGTVKPEYQ